MPPVPQPLFQEGVHLGWQGWTQGLAGGDVQPYTAKGASSLNCWLFAISKLTSRRKEKKHHQRIGFAISTYFKHFFFVFILLNIKCVSLPIELPHFSFQLEFSMVLVWIAIQFFRLPFKSLLHFMQFMQIYVSESEFHIRNIKTALQMAAYCTV